MFDYFSISFRFNKYIKSVGLYQVDCTENALYKIRVILIDSFIFNLVPISLYGFDIRTAWIFYQRY